MSSISQALAADNLPSIMALCSEDVTLGGDFWRQTTQTFRPPAYGKAAFQAGLQEFIDVYGPVDVHISLDREPDWRGEFALCYVTIQVSQRNASRLASSAVTWTDVAHFVHADQGWLLDQLCGIGYHNQGGM